MVSTRGKKRKIDEVKEEEDEDLQLVVSEPSSWWVRGDVWYEDGNVVLLATGDVGFKVS